MIIETHCHLDYLESKPLDEILKDSQNVGVSKIITIGVSSDNLDIVYDLAQNYSQVYCSQGIHPHDAKLATELDYKKIRLRALNSKMVAVGEIGLDYHYNNSPPEVQRQVFSDQIQIATEINLPLIIHSREAEQDTMNILNQYKSNAHLSGVIHSFTSSLDLAKFALSLGFYLGFNGIITFKNADELRKIVSYCPLESILVETDSPFLTPMPHRGKENNPSYLPFVIDAISKIKNLSSEEVRIVTTQNAEKLFSKLTLPLT